MRTGKIFCALLPVLMAGCVSVTNRDGINPPPALCCCVRATIGVPKGEFDAQPPKSYTQMSGYFVQDWVFSGASVDVENHAIKYAAEEGGLSEVEYAEYELVSYFGFVNQLTLTVYGR